MEEFPDVEAQKENECKTLATKEVWETGVQQEKDEYELLKDPMLLLKIIQEIHNRGVQGEEDTILVLTNKIMLRLVKNYSPTSSNIIVSDESGGGKDVIAKAVTKLLVPEEKLFHRTRLSEKALEYWGTDKPKDWTWDEHIFYLEDPEEETLKSQAFRVLASGGNCTTTVKDQKLYELQVKGKPVIIVTSLNASIDEEGGRRWDAVRVDISQELTRKVIHEKLKKQLGKISDKSNTFLQHALQKLLISYDVVIPFAEQLSKNLPLTLIMRTQVDKLCDYIKASAILHQYQREKDEDGRLIATWFDYDFARFIFIKLRDAEGKALNKDEEEFIEVLRKAGKSLSIKEISEKYKRHGRKWIYEHLDSFKNKGLIEEEYERDEYANKDILKLKSCYGYSAIELPESSVFTGFHVNGENQNKEGCNGFHGFFQVLEEINKERQNHGLSPLKLVKTNKTDNTSLLEVFTTENKTTQNPSFEQEKKPLNERINEVKSYIEQVISAGNEGVSKIVLIDHFDADFIAKLIEKELLERLPNGNYKWNENAT